MRAPWARPFPSATSPAELRRRLRAAGAPLRAAAQRVDALERVSTRIPPTLLGASLLSLLSANLSAALNPAGPAADAQRERRRPRPMLTRPRTEEEGTRTAPGELLPSAVALPPRPAGEPRSEGHAERSWSGAGHGGTAAARICSAATTPALRKRILDYLELTRARTGPRFATTAREGRSRPRGEPARAAEVSPARESWAERASTVVAALASFTGASLRTDGGNTPSFPLASSEHAPGPLLRAFDSPSSVRETHLRRDLSERMAEILREQALAHGIDLT